MINFVRTGLSLAVAGALMAGASAPVFARGVLHVGHTDDGASVRYNPRTDQYCVSTPMTGSRIPKVACKSQSEWAEDGLSITRK
jgi:hypothetical protein